MGWTLGVSAFYHDSAAALVNDGAIIAAAQEERFTRVKHDPGFPANAIRYCLEEARIEPSDLDSVVFYDDPVLTLDRILSSMVVADAIDPQYVERTMRSQLEVKLRSTDYARAELGDVPVRYTCHHLAHAASAFYPSPFAEAAILTMDGVGEWDTTSIVRGDGRQLTPMAAIQFPHSLGLLYSAFTAYTGFKVNSGEYKLMGLAPYGDPRFASLIRDHLIELKPDGSFALNLDYFAYTQSDAMTTPRFDELFGGPAREQESRITRREMDLAASIQAVTEDAVLGLARRAKEITGSSNLCLAGGVALNCVANGRIVREQIFDEIWIQPAAGDAGGALGAALIGSEATDGAFARPTDGRDGQAGSHLGMGFSDAEVAAALDAVDAVYEVVPDDDDLAEQVAARLADGEVVGFFAGRMEFGPRSLGARSILGDPRNSEMQTQLNLKIKFRESFRPFAPAVLAEQVSDWFDLEVPSPYMLLVAPVREDRRTPAAEAAAAGAEPGDDADDMLAVVRQVRSEVPAVTHVDYSARVQTVSGDGNPAFRRVLEAFEAKTGCPVLVNTSFNVRGEPIVATPEDAYRCFMRTDMDVLVVEHALVVKSEQPEWEETDDWRERYDD